MNQKISKVMQETKPKKPILKNALRAFLVGGLICLFGQVLIFLFQKGFNFSKEEASNITVGLLVLIACLLTGFGVYDRIGQFAGAGTIVPITGFANSMASSALESKSEGIIVGIIMNMFKLAGSVIVVGVLSAYNLGLIRYLWGLIV